MTFVTFAAILLVVLFVWGLLWPRSQWRVLVSWSRRRPEAAEPGPLAYAAQRGISALGLLLFAVAGGMAVADHIRSLPQPEATPTPLQQMWGAAPVPQVVDRVVQGSAQADPSLAEAHVGGYQVVDNASSQPRYLAFLESYVPPGVDGSYIGQNPGVGFSALDSAELVVSLRPAPSCVPQQVVVIETPEAVQVGVFTGLNGTMPAPGVGNSWCAGGSLVGPTLLLPLNLTEALGDRPLQTLDGTPIPRVPVIESR